MGDDAKYNEILYEVKDGVAWITINRPEVMNAFREQTLDELIDAFQSTRHDPTIAVAVVTGAGDEAFSAGGDFHAMMRLNWQNAAQWNDRMLGCAMAIRGLHIPVIAMITGWCMGGGHELALWCDIAIASDDATLGQTGARVGACPTVGATQYIPRLIGERLAREMIFGCRTFKGPEAAQVGLINRSVPKEKLRETVEEFCERIKGYSSQTIRQTKRSLNFETRIAKAEWDEAAARWQLTTNRGDRYSAKYLIESVGLLSSTNVPAFPGLETFKGEVHHSARWPDGVDLRGKRVGVIGTGSTGTQVITEVASEAEHLYVFQRTPQYVVPLGTQHPISPDAVRRIEEDPDEYFAWALDSGAVFGFKESTVSALGVSPEERERVYETAWEKGNGFAFMLETFADIVTDKKANDTATDFVRSKIRQIVKDPDVAAKLMPHDLYAKRPLAVDNYYEVFNRDNVTLVDVKADPIKGFSETALQTAAAEYELDVLAIATGFDAMTGNYLKIETIGRDGVRLQDKWNDGPQTFGGVSIAGFPNLFMVFGPMGPFTSQPLVHEWQIKWFTSLIRHAEENGIRSIEANKDAEAEWCKLCFDIADQTLFPQCDSWINGANIPGKPKVTMWYMGGMSNYMVELERVADNGYKEYRLGN